MNCIFDFFIFLQLLHYFPVLSISFFANINPSFCICCIIQIFLLFLLLLSMHDKYFFNKLWIIFTINHTIINHEYFFVFHIIIVLCIISCVPFFVCHFDAYTVIYNAFGTD